jgi:hypothetical protein
LSCNWCFVADGEPIPLDDAGNPLLGDIGLFLKKAIKTAIPDATLKYIDPTYMVQVTSVHSSCGASLSAGSHLGLKGC